MFGKADINEPIPVEEAARTIADALLFAGDNSSPHNIAEADPCDGTIIVTLTRSYMFKRGPSRKFKITVEAVPDDTDCEDAVLG